MRNFLRRIFRKDEPATPRAVPQIVVPCEKYDRADFIAGAERLAVLFLRGSRIVRSIGAEREMLDFASTRVREKATSALDTLHPGQGHYGWLREKSLDRLRELRAELEAIKDEMGRIASRLDP